MCVLSFICFCHESSSLESFWVILLFFVFLNALLFTQNIECNIWPFEECHPQYSLSSGVQLESGNNSELFVKILTNNYFVRGKVCEICVRNKYKPLYANSMHTFILWTWLELSYLYCWNAPYLSYKVNSWKQSCVYTTCKKKKKPVLPL